MDFLEYVHQNIYHRNLAGELCRAIVNDPDSYDILNKRDAWMDYLSSSSFNFDGNYIDDPLVPFEFLWDDYLMFGQVTEYDLDEEEYESFEDDE